MQTSRPVRTRATRLSGAARATWGVACLVAPREVARAIGGTPVNDRTADVVRVLGLRQVLQGAITGLRPRRRVLEVGGGVDLAHAATMVALAALDPPRRRLAGLEALAAAGWGLGTLTLALDSPAQTAARDQERECKTHDGQQRR